VIRPENEVAGVDVIDDAGCVAGLHGR
jgi:hypothetical protein